MAEQNERQRALQRLNDSTNEAESLRDNGTRKVGRLESQSGSGSESQQECSLKLSNINQRWQYFI
jgi:hypothetical protein